MAGFIMTLDSDDDAPNLSPPSSPRLTSTASTSSAPPHPNKGKLTKSQQKAAAKAAANKKSANKKGNKKGQQQQKKKKEVSSDDDDDDSESESEQGVSEDELGRMDKGFVFDGLGGGFVGDRRNNVWDSGEAYIQKRPNAMPRVTVDEIIARRAPEREAAKAMKEAQALLDEVDDEEEDELEKEMLEELEGLEDGDEEEGWGGIGSGSDEGEDEDEDSEEDDEGSEGDSEDEPAEKMGAEEVAAEQEGDEENWLGLSDKEEGGDESGAEDEQDGEGKAAPSGFAALADFEDDADMSDALSAASAPSDAEGADKPSASEAALAKSFFTAHKPSTSASKKALSFSTLPSCTLSRPLLLALASLNLSTPTPIQAECIPLAMLGKDIVASSATGSGKTVAFWVGVLERLLHRDRKGGGRTRVVVMCPTRELAVQVHGVGVALARFTDVTFCLCVGGLSLKAQEAELKQRPDVVVSTPGRLIDHVRNTPCFTMDAVEVLVLDEADRMLEEGFRDELEEIITAAPRSRQTLLFSATVTESVSQLTRLSMNKPVRVKIDEMGAAARGLEQEFLRVRGDKPGENVEFTGRSGERHRESLLISLCTRSFSSGRTIIFFRSKAQAHRMKILFTLYGKGLERSDELHGDLTQEQRLSSLKRFREGEVGFLLATDLASRGLDIKGIENVINYEMPRSLEIYLHRVGRTARAGKKGRALTLVGESDRKLVKLAMKHAPPESVKQRTVPADVVASVAKELKAMEGEVKAVVQEEREEKEIRRGNMEVQKAQNMLEHADEIKARPARTWFQSQSEKNASSNLGKKEHNSKFPEKANKKRGLSLDDDDEGPKAPRRTPFSGLSRREKRRKMAARDDEEDHETGYDRELGASIRSAKKAARPGRLTTAKPERTAEEMQQQRKKKKAKVGKFDREIGVAQDGPGAAGKEKRAGKRERAMLKGGGTVKNKLGSMGPKAKRK
ncbi:hypothetical protein JCM11251_002640 [Rhodosporidiobolus azoricus]